MAYSTRKDKIRMKILLIGAGGQGAPCASILSKDKDIEKILLADVNGDMARKVADKIGSDKITAIQMNAGNIDEIVSAAKGKDVIIDLISTSFTVNIMKAALMAGGHYVNSAFSRDIWDFELDQSKKPKLYDEFEQKGLSALLGCGMSAGYTNVLARKYIDKLDKVKSVKIRLAKKDTSVSELEEILEPWNPGWNPRIAFMDFVNSTTIFEDGQYKTYEKPFSQIETWKFPEPVGQMPVALHAHEEPYSMPMTLKDKGLEYCDFKYYVNKQIAPMVALGFGTVNNIEMHGVDINPLDVLLRMVPKPGDAFLSDDPSTFEYKDRYKHVSIMIQIIGQIDGKEKKYMITIPDMNKPRKKIYELFGTTSVNVALPTVIGAKMVYEGSKKGVIFSEELNPERFLELLENTGYPNKWETDES